MQLSSSLKFKDPRSLQIEGDAASAELLKECLEHHQCVRKLHILDIRDLFLKVGSSICGHGQKLSADLTSFLTSLKKVKGAFLP